MVTTVQPRPVGCGEAEGVGAPWHVTFGVAVVVSTGETGWTRLARLRDPGGAEVTVSRFVPPG